MGLIQFISIFGTGLKKKTNLSVEKVGIIVVGKNVSHSPKITIENKEFDVVFFMKNVNASTIGVTLRGV